MDPPIENKIKVTKVKLTFDKRPVGWKSKSILRSSNVSQENVSSSGGSRKNERKMAGFHDRCVSPVPSSSCPLLPLWHVYTRPPVPSVEPVHVCALSHLLHFRPHGPVARSGSSGLVGFPRQEHWAGHALLQGIFLTQGSNLSLLTPTLADGLYQLSHQRRLCWAHPLETTKTKCAEFSKTVSIIVNGLLALQTIAAKSQRAGL